MGSSWWVSRYFDILFCWQIYVTLRQGPLLVVRKFTFKLWNFSCSTIHARSAVWWFPANRWSAQTKSAPIVWSSHRDSGFRNDSPIASQIIYKIAEMRTYDVNAFIITEKISGTPNTYWRETGLNRFVMSLIILDIIHRPEFYLKQRFGDWSLYPFSGGSYSVGPSR
jgi:hypothetical protein